jgi:hypothetical protein
LFVPRPGGLSVVRLGDYVLAMSRARVRVLVPVALVVASLVLGLGALAYAKSYAVPSALGGVLDKTRSSTALAILLPSRLALDYDGRVYASGGGDSKSYDLSLAGAPGCGGASACFLVTFSAKRGSTVDFRRKVALRGGRTGFYKPLTCGGSCSPPIIQWRGRGNVYSIQAKVLASGGDAGARRAMVAAANSAIGAGRR